MTDIKLSTRFQFQEGHDDAATVIRILTNLSAELGDDALISVGRDHIGPWIEVRRAEPAPVLRLVGQGGDPA